MLLSHPKPSSLTKSVNLNRHIRVWYPICGTWNMGSLCVVDFVASVEKDLATNAKIFNFRAQLMNGFVHTQKTPLGNDNRCFRHDRGFHIIVYEDNKMNSVTSPRRWNLFLFWLWLDSLSLCCYEKSINHRLTSHVHPLETISIRCGPLSMLIASSKSPTHSNSLSR